LTDFFCGEWFGFSFDGFVEFGVSVFEVHGEAAPFFVGVELEGDDGASHGEGEGGAFAVFTQVSGELSVLEGGTVSDAAEDTFGGFIGLGGRDAGEEEEGGEEWS